MAGREGCESTIGGTGGGRACLFPFQQDGVEYHACTTEGIKGNQYWCKTVGGGWGHCKQNCYSDVGKLYFK